MLETILASGEQGRDARAVALFDRCARSYGGEPRGDVAIFEEAVDALCCALLLQAELRDAGATPLRLGVHLGEVRLESGSPTGPDAEIARRLARECEPGSVYASRAAWILGGRGSGLRAHLLGERDLGRRVPVYEVTGIPRAPRVRDRPRLLNRAVGVRVVALAVVIFAIYALRSCVAPPA